ncbi:FUSC family protein [Enterobacterales bacterium AE_CKDN230030158-1A_HGKHYDSX7]
MNDLQPEGISGRFRWLLAELAPFPGRGNFALRLTLASALAIIVGEVFRIPSMALSIVAVLVATQASIVLTRVVFFALLIANGLSIGLFVLVMNLTYDYPLLRIVSSGVVFFCAMYCQRISKLGALLLGPGLVLLYAQSFADLTDQAEYLVRQMLWSVVSITYGSALGVLVNTLLPGADPQRQWCDETHRQLSAAAQRLQAAQAGEALAPALAAPLLQRQVASLQALLSVCAMANAHDYAGNLYRQACAAAVSHIQGLGNELPGDRDALSPAVRQILGRLSEQVQALDGAISRQLPFRLDWVPSESERSALSSFAPAQDIFLTLQALDRFDSTPLPDQAAVKEPLLVPDAFSNPAYTRFALKVLICGMTGYFVFNVLQWPGIHTILITSAMVALPGLGTSVRHMSLRFYGALAGSVAAFIIFLFIMPHLDSLLGLLLALLPVIGLGAWVTAGSERLAYFGTQGVATFALPFFDRFGPTTDLSEIRDRMVGILLGVGICWFVYTVLWPESEDSQERSKLASLVRAMAELLRTPLAAEQPMAYAARRLECWSQINEGSELLERVRYEPSYQQGEPAHRVRQAETLLAMSRNILILQDRLRSQALADLEQGMTPLDPSSPLLALREESALLLEVYADRLVQSAPAPRQEQARLGEHARSLLVAEATSPLAEGMKSLALEIAALPDWSSQHDDAHPAAGRSDAPVAPEKLP